MRERALFDRVIEGAANEVGDVLVRQRVEDVLAGAAAPNEVLGPQEAQLLRDGGQADTGSLGQLRDTPLAIGEAHQEPEPRFVPRGAEDGGGAIERVVRDRRA